MNWMQKIRNIHIATELRKEPYIKYLPDVSGIHSGEVVNIIAHILEHREIDLESFLLNALHKGIKDQKFIDVFKKDCRKNIDCFMKAVGYE